MQLTSFAAAEAALAAFLPSRLERTAYTTEYIQQFLAYVGDPQDACPAIHIAGTSGKTSTAYYAASLLQAAGKKVGLLTSPHVYSLGERVQINLRPLSERRFCRDLTAFLQLVAESGVPLTYAEILYAFAFWQFAHARLDYIVIETGQGGLLDATNTMTRPDKVCIITDIGRDHMATLGTTLPEITRHKAGIIGLHNAVFCYEQAPAIMEVLRATARQKQADLHRLPAREWHDLASNLPLFQQRNSHLALRAVGHVLEREAAPALTTQQIKKALQVVIPGRMEVLKAGNKTIIIDGAHNPQKLQALRASLQQQYMGQPVAALVAFVESKSRSAHELARALRPLAQQVIATGLPTDSSHTFRPPATIAYACQAAEVPCEAEPDLTAALQRLLARPEPVLVITGSLYLVQPARAALAGILGATVQA